MPVRVLATVRISADRRAAISAQVAGLSDDKLGEFAREVKQQAQQNASAMPFDESTGELAREIYDVRMGEQHYRVETRSGHASFIEFGTQFIKGKMPIIWPAYRAVKKKFLKAGKWL